MITKPLLVNPLELESHEQSALVRTMDEALLVSLELFRISGMAIEDTDKTAQFMGLFMSYTAEVISRAQSSLLYDLMDEDDRTAMEQEAESYRTVTGLL